MAVFTALVFVACGLAGIALWLTGRRNALGLAPTGQLFDLILGERAVRMTVLVFWWWIGWHFLVARTIDP
jgi:hypothetical protein